MKINRGKNFISRLNQLKSKGLVIVVAGAILVASSALTMIDAKAQGSTPKEDEEVSLDLKFTADSKDNSNYSEEEDYTSYFDVFNDDELSYRAFDILSEVEKVTGSNNYTEEELRSMMMIFAGRNPFSREIQDGDVMFSLDRLNQIMDAEGQEVGNRFRGIRDAKVKAIIPYSAFLPDGTQGQDHATIISDMRSKMLLSNTNEEAMPYANDFTIYVFNYYFANGRLATPGFDEVERAGYRLFNLALVLNTANIAVAINPDTKFQFEISVPVTLEDGTISNKAEVCEWDLPFMINQLLTAPCAIIDGEDMYQAKVNYLTDAILGTKAQAVMPDQLHK